MKDEIPESTQTQLVKTTEVKVVEEDIDQSKLDLIARFIELDKKKATIIKQFYEEFDEVVEQMIAALGLGYHFQDTDGTVYVTDRMLWKAMKITPYEIRRTRREGETKGSLSLTEARGYGYTVEGK